MEIVGDWYPVDPPFVLVGKRSLLVDIRLLVTVSLAKLRITNRRESQARPMTGSGSDSMNTLLLGLDGACLPVLDRLLDANAIPTIESLLEDGYVDDLTSQIPPWTPSAWPSLYTGVNPGRHGVYGFLTFDGYDWDVVDRTNVREYALWELLDEHGYSSVVVNVPVTHPPREIDGAIVPGYVAPENPECVPEDALSRCTEKLDGDEYRIYPPQDGTRSDRLDTYADLVESRGIVFRTLVEQFDPAFGFLQFQQTDTVFHEHPGDWDVIEHVYTAVDDTIRNVLESCQPRNVIVVSDHGIGEYNGYEFRVNEFLREEGYVTTVRGGDGMPSWDSIARNQLRNGEQSDKRNKGVLERTAALAAKAGLTSQRLERLLKRVGLASTVAAIVPTDVIRAGTEQVNFENSQAYMRSRIELGVRINLAGREPDGVVTQEQYESVRDELLNTLRAVQTPDGKPVFDAVEPREAVFEGPYIDDAPDIVLVPASFDHFLSGSLLGEQFGPPSEPWNHKRAGVIIATGPDITVPNGETQAASDGGTQTTSSADAQVASDAGTQAGSDSKTPHLFDVAPTVLATFDVPPSERMDGTTLPIVESHERTQYPEFNAREIRTNSDKAVAKHLANLGYLEDV